MSLPQFGIFAQGTVAHYFQEFDLRPNVGIAQGALRSAGSPDPLIVHLNRHAHEAQ